MVRIPPFGSGSNSVLLDVHGVLNRVQRSFSGARNLSETTTALNSYWYSPVDRIASLRHILGPHSGATRWTLSLAAGSGTSWTWTLTDYLWHFQIWWLCCLRSNCEPGANILSSEQYLIITMTPNMFELTIKLYLFWIKVHRFLSVEYGVGVAQQFVITTLNL